MMEEYLKKYGLSKSNKIEFAKRNLVIGKNGSGKTRFLKAYRDFCLGQYKNIIYIYFPALSAKDEEKFEKIDVDSGLRRGGHAGFDFGKRSGRNAAAASSGT